MIKKIPFINFPVAYSIFHCFRTHPVSSGIVGYKVGPAHMDIIGIQFKHNLYEFRNKRDEKDDPEEKSEDATVSFEVHSFTKSHEQG